MSLTVAQLVARLTADTSNFYRGMALANASMIRSGGIITRVAAGAGLATLGMGIMSLRAAGSYQQSMNILEAVSGATTRQMKALDTEAINLGADIKLPNVSAKDAADSMTQLAKAGLSVKDIMGATRGVLQLGLAANIDFADSATITARALKMFGLQGNKATMIANLFAAGANASTAEIQDLAYGMQNAGSQFEGAGYSIQDLVVSLSALVDRGLSGEQAGTALKTMLQRLQNPTKKAADLLKSLGVNIADAGGHMLPLPAIVSQFAAGFRKLNPLQRQQALNTIFGARANQAMSKLLGIGAKGWENYSNKIVGTNAAQKLAEARTKGFQGAIGGLGSQIETLAITLGKAMLPAATNVAHALSNFVASIDPQKIIGFFSAIKDGIAFFVNLTHSSVLLQAVLGSLLAGFVAYQTVMFAVTAVTRAFAIAQGIMNAVMEANPIVLIITALAALAVGLYIAYQRSETFRNIVQTAFSAVKSAASWIQDMAQIVIAAFQRIYSTVRPILQVIETVVSTVFRAIQVLVTAAVNIISSVVTGAWRVIAATTTAVWNVIKTIITSVIGVITGKISAMTALKNIVGAVWNGIKSITQTTWSAIKGIIGTTVQEIGNVLRTGISIAYNAAVGIGKAIVNGVLNGVEGLASSLKNKVEGGLKSAISHLNPFSPVEHGGEIYIGKPLADGAIMGWINGSAELPSKISETLKNALNRAKAEIDASKQSFADSFSRLADYAMNAFDAITQKHMTPAEKLLNQLVSQHDQAELQSRLDDATAAVAQAQQDIAKANSAEYSTAEERSAAVAAAERNLTDAIAQQKEAQYQIRIAALQKTADAENLQYEAQRNLRKQHLQDELNDLEAALAKHPEKYRFYQNKIIALLNSFGINYRSSGIALGRAFAQGLRESEGEVLAAARKIAQEVANILKLRSPAKEGPLSDLDTWWTPFGATLLQGLNTSTIKGALQDALTPAGLGVGLPSGNLGTPGASGMTGAAPVQNIFYVAGSLVSENDLNNRIRSGINQEAQRGRVIAT